MPIIIVCSELPTKEEVCIATCTQVSVPAGREAVERLLYKRSSRVPGAHAVHMRDGDSYKLFGNEGQSMKYEPQKVVL